MTSVNTNVGAMIALQNLNVTNAELATTQNRINTGKKVASVKDNGAIWAIAQGQRADIGALGAVKQSLDRGVAAVDVAMAAGETVAKTTGRPLASTWAMDVGSEASTATRHSPTCAHGSCRRRLLTWSRNAGSGSSTPRARKYGATAKSRR